VSYVWYVIALLTVVNAFNYMDRMALSVLVPSIKADLQLSDTQIGLLTGLAFSLFYAVCAVPIARYADRGARRNVIALALATWSVMTALCGIARNFWSLFLVRIGVGAGEAGGLAPAQSVLCDYVPVERRAGVFAIHTFGLAIGLFAGMALGSRLGEAVGWRLTFVVLGVPGLVLAFLVFLTLREPARGFFDRGRGNIGNLPLAETVAVLWRCRTYRLLMAFGVVGGFVENGLTQWWPSFFTREFGLSMSLVGMSLGVANGIGLGIGLLGGGFLANRLTRRDPKLPLLVGSAIYFLALPAFLGSLFTSSGHDSMLLIAAARSFQTIPTGAILAALFSVTPPRSRAIAGAFNNFFIAAGGYTLGPFCVGLLSDWLAPKMGVEALRYALLAPIALIPVIVLILYAAARALPRDLKSA
jgi:predicted MFS family arabinose efflux permease